MTKTIDQFYAAHSYNVLTGAETLPLMSAGVMGGTTVDSLGAAILNDTDVAALPTVLANTNAISTLTSQVSALSTQSSLVARRGIGTAVTNATTVVSDLYGGDTTIPFVGDDGMLYFGTFWIWNQNTVGSGTNLSLNLLIKFNGGNSFNPPNPILAPTGASTFYILDLALIMTAGANASTHTQQLRMQIRNAVASSNGSLSYGIASDAVTANRPFDVAQIISSTGFDWGTGRPSVEVRLNASVADVNTGVQRIQSELSFIKDH